MTRWTIAAAVLILISPLCLRAQGQFDKQEGPYQQTASLLEFKAELASEGRPYLHITADSVLLYFRGILLKRLPIRKLNDLECSYLSVGRILQWTPRAVPPAVTLDDLNRNRVEALRRRLTLEEVPSTFGVQLTDGTRLLVSPNASASAWKELNPSKTVDRSKTVDQRTLLLKMSSHYARQLHWHLQQEMAVIY